MSAIFLVACLVLLIVPIYFVTHKVYEDGFFGRIGLLGVSFSAATFLLEWIDGEGFEVLPQTVMMVSCFALFLCWHLFRFHRRVVCKVLTDDPLSRQRAPVER